MLVIDRKLLTRNLPEPLGFQSRKLCSVDKGKEEGRELSTLLALENHIPIKSRPITVLDVCLQEAVAEPKYYQIGNKIKVTNHSKSGEKCRCST